MDAYNQMPDAVRPGAAARETADPRHGDAPASDELSGARDEKQHGHFTADRAEVAA
jgi:hypothetical protein